MARRLSLPALAAAGGEAAAVAVGGPDTALAADRRRLCAALKVSGAGLFEYGIPAGRGRYCSERFAEILGYAREELPPAAAFSEWFFEQIHPDERGTAETACRDVLEGQSHGREVELRVRCKQGGWKDVACRLEAADCDEQGRVTAVIGALADRTEQKRMEEQLRRAQRMEAVGRLAGGVAHDFNNLLTVISNFGEFVAEQLAPNTPVHDDMCEVLNAARRAEQLTRQLLTFSRRQPADLKTVKLNDLVADIDKMLRRLLGEDVEYATHLASDLWDVRVDPGSLEQVFVNLAINGRDAMANGGKLTIETRNSRVAEGRVEGVPPGRYVVVSVTDEGIGMDAETRERMFEPFFTTKGPENGTGLGLATCYGIVKQSGGFIVVRSEPGEGTTFSVYLPRAPGEDAHVPEEPFQAVGSAESILVVEDETAVRSLIVRVLSQLGYGVLEATNGAEALRIAQQSEARIRLLLTDVVMPEMNGPQLVERLKSTRPELKVLYMSGYTRGAIELEDEAALVRKPFSPKQLVDRVRATLGTED